MSLKLGTVQTRADEVGDSPQATSSSLSPARDSPGRIEAYPLKSVSAQVAQVSNGESHNVPGAQSDRSSQSSSTTPLDRAPSDRIRVPAGGRLSRWYHDTATSSKSRLQGFFKVLRLDVIWYWIQGPSPPRKLTFNPLFPQLQSIPARVLNTTNSQVLFVCLCCAFWLAGFSSLLATSAFGSLSDSDAQQPYKLSCVSALWDSAPSCGIDGNDCQPFEDASFPFLCPGDCLTTQVLEPHTIGDEEINYRSLVIGGPNASDDNRSTYRGDSFICGAALHAGVITNQHGGCGILTRRGERKNFSSTEGNGILSIGFPSSFPLSFSVESINDNCKDPQWNTFIVSVLATVLFSLFTTSPVIFFSTTFVIVFFQIGLVSDSPYYIDFASLLSSEFARFLPAAFIAVVVYFFCVKQTLRDIRAPLERTILWVGGCWVGALNNYTFDRIPLSRLTSHDLQQQPGAITALVIIVLVIVAAAIGQVWAFRLEGRLVRYLRFYIMIAIIIGCLIAIPALDFRLHHYILGLLLLPGTSVQTRPSFLWQGLLFGLFINGIARWGFASILQTPAALLGDGQSGSALPTNISHSILFDTISFTISQISNGFDGLSILVNDVERFQRSQIEPPVSFNWTRTDPDETLFFRFAFTGTYNLGGVGYGDYTKPGLWFGNGTWQEMLPGPSR